jgi:hypothetical protein
LKATVKRLRAFLEPFERIAITGPPSCGKTTLTLKLNDGKRKIFHSDDFKHLEWSEASERMAKEANEHDGPCIIEGVAVPRALRKGMRADVVLWLSKPWKEQKPGQVAMGRGCKTVLDEWRIQNTHIPVVHFEEDDA